MIVLFLIIAGLGFWVFKLTKKSAQVVQINAEKQQENEKIEQALRDNKADLQRVKQELQSVKTRIADSSNVVKSLTKTAEAMRESAERQAEESAQARFAQVSKELQDKYANLEADCQLQLALVQRQVETEEEKVADLKAKQQAYLEAQRREEEKEADVDYYRMVLNLTDTVEVKALRELQKTFSHKDAIDKVIWETYYRSTYDTLASHFFKGATDKKCGIYKITSITTGAAYIGQSVDIRERWRQHIKTSLGSAPATNALYQAMKKYGPENFTFEILEEVPKDKLNEREVYWIDFYGTKSAGLNKTKGGA